MKNQIHSFHQAAENMGKFFFKLNKKHILFSKTNLSLPLILPSFMNRTSGG